MSTAALPIPDSVGPGPGRSPFTVHRFATITSTNSYLAELALQGAPAGTVAVAAHQSAGRGRLGRRWEAPPGANLLLSVLLRPRMPVEGLHLCSVVVALAVAEACEALAGVRAELKWPNDLLVASRKLAGVLAESVPAAEGGEGGRAVVVGVGCNVGWPAPGEPLPEGAPDATSLALSTPTPPTVAELLDVVLLHLARRVGDLDDELGRHRQASAYRAACATLGRRVRIELPGETFTGTAADVTAEGHLLVDTPAGRRTVTAGDVVHLRPGA